MLVRFSVQNFRSIGEKPLTLNMVSSSKIRDHANHIVNLNPARILRDAVIYGANAAGKSNLIKALMLLIETVNAGHLQSGIESSFCKNITKGEERDTTFDIQFEVNGDFYGYGFTCNLSRRTLKEEWLCELGVKEEKPLFKRTESSVECFFLNMIGEKSKKRIDVYVDDFENEIKLGSNKLFLTALNQGKEFNTESGLDFLSKTYTWLTSNIIIAAPSSRLDTDYVFYNDDLDRAAELIASFDTGISFLKMQEISIEELKGNVPPQVMKFIQDALDNAPHLCAMTLRGGDVIAQIEIEGDEGPKISILKLTHTGSNHIFDFEEESDGTKRLFDILDMLLTSSEDTVFVVDELSRSFHPLLTKHFVDLFNDIHADDRCQLIFTTHENDVMSFDHFRKDEIWFVERNNDGLSELYPLDEFAIRSDARIERNYMKGRYGGIPVLSMQKSLTALKGTPDSKSVRTSTDEQES